MLSWPESLSTSMTESRKLCNPEVSPNLSGLGVSRASIEKLTNCCCLCCTGSWLVGLEEKLPLKSHFVTRKRTPREPRSWEVTEWFLWSRLQPASSKKCEQWQICGLGVGRSVMKKSCSSHQESPRGTAFRILLVGYCRSKMAGGPSWQLLKPIFVILVSPVNLQNLATGFRQGDGKTGRAGFMAGRGGEGREGREGRKDTPRFVDPFISWWAASTRG